MGLEYKTQQTFYGCTSELGNMLLFDFYVPKFHTCIEYDGYHHFFPINAWGGDDGFKKRSFNDEIKTKYCKENDINLIRIPYTSPKEDIVKLLNKTFNKNLIFSTKKRTKWIDINIMERVNKYKTRGEFLNKDRALYDFCRRNNLLDEVCKHMSLKFVPYTYEHAKEITQRYTDWTLFANEYRGLVKFIKNNNHLELTQHMEKNRLLRTDEEIIEEMKKYKYKMDFRRNEPAVYAIALKRKLIHMLKDKTTWWNRESVEEVFKKCRTKKELKKLYRGADNYARKHNIYDELSIHFTRDEGPNVVRPV
jgi:hypothetical protein